MKSRLVNFFSLISTPLTPRHSTPGKRSLRQYLEVWVTQPGMWLNYYLNGRIHPMRICQAYMGYKWIHGEYLLCLFKWSCGWQFFTLFISGNNGDNSWQFMTIHQTNNTTDLKSTIWLTGWLSKGNVKQPQMGISHGDTAIQWILRNKHGDTTMKLVEICSSHNFFGVLENLSSLLNCGKCSSKKNMFFSQLPAVLANVP